MIFTVYYEFKGAAYVTVAVGNNAEDCRRRFERENPACLVREVRWSR